MKYYPVMIPTLNRFAHFKRCVESLSRNTHADKTELIIGLDYPPSEKYVEGYAKIKEYIPTISGFLKVTVFERSENYGPSKNWVELQKYAFEHYDAVICSEDDNEFSPNFLDFINKGLDKYRHSPKVIAITGYTPPISRKNYSSNTFASQNFSAWGVAIWKNKDDSFPEDYSAYCKGILRKPFLVSKILRKDFRMVYSLIDSAKTGRNHGDRIWTLKCLIEDKYCICPSLSLVRNWGHDGSGVHCGVVENDIFKEQIISTNSLFDLDDVNLGMNIMYKRQSAYFNGYFLHKMHIVLKVIRMFFK